MSQNAENYTQNFSQKSKESTVLPVVFVCLALFCETESHYVAWLEIRLASNSQRLPSFYLLDAESKHAYQPTWFQLVLKHEQCLH